MSDSVRGSLKTDDEKEVLESKLTVELNIDYIVA